LKKIDHGTHVSLVLHYWLNAVQLCLSSLYIFKLIILKYFFSLVNFEIGNYTLTANLFKPVRYGFRRMYCLVEHLLVNEIIFYTQVGFSRLFIANLINMLTGRHCFSQII